MDTITTTQNLLTCNGSAQPVMVALTQNEMRLIAAAPELLALAVRYASECSECEGSGYVVVYADPYAHGDVSSPEQSPCESCVDIRAAIAAATGETE